MAPLQTHYPLWSTIRLHPDTPPIELKPPIRHLDETHWSALWVYNPIWIFTSKLSRPIQIHIRTIMTLKMNSSKKSQPFFFFILQMNFSITMACISCVLLFLMNYAFLHFWINGFFLGFVFFSIVYRIASFSLHQLYLAGSVPLIDLPKSTVLTHQRFYDTLCYLCSKEIIYITRVISLVHLSLVNIYRNTDSNYLLLDI